MTITLDNIPGLTEFLISEHIEFDYKKGNNKHKVVVNLPDAENFYKLGLKVGTKIAEGTIKLN